MAKTGAQTLLPYINIDGVDWDNPSPLRYARAMPIQVGVGLTGLSAVFSLVSYPLYVAAIAVPVGLAFTVASYGAIAGTNRLRTRFDMLRWRSSGTINDYAIDTSGQAPPLAKHFNLMEQTKQLHDAMKSYAMPMCAFATVKAGICAAAAGWEIYTQGSMYIAPLLGFAPLPMAVIGASYTDYMLRTQKLLDNDYVFVEREKPLAQTALQRLVPA